MEENKSVLRLNCALTVKAEDVAKVVELAKELVEYSRKDEGCIDYDILQSQTNPCQLLIFETWASQACLDVHMAAPHFTRLVPQIQAFGELQIEIFKK